MMEKTDKLNVTNRAQRTEAAARFAELWMDRGYERGDTQTFWLTLVRDVLGVEKPEELISFEERARLDHTGFMDARIPSTRVLIEQKSLGKNLRAPIRQSDGTFLNPFRQASRYILSLPVSQHPRWVVTSNFAEFLIYDMEQPGSEPESIKLTELPREWPRLQFLVDSRAEMVRRQTEVSVRAAAIIGELYDLLRQEYNDPDAPSTLHSLNRLGVRLVFCLYAEDSAIFHRRNAFAELLLPYRDNPAVFRRTLMELFDNLDIPRDRRDPYLDPQINAFPYVNGGLFAGRAEIPRLSREFIDALIDRASLGTDWSGISPTIFGAVFESTLNPATRHDGGMHYTSIENIHKVIDPLFLDALRAELEEIKGTCGRAKLRQRLAEFRRRLGELTFLDPACGSGNFLTETYISLRRLENDALRAWQGRQTDMYFDEDVSPINVRIDNFHGIEINDFAVTVAQTALWIAESQMMAETAGLLRRDLDFLPLKSYNTIVEGDALATDWAEVVNPARLRYIISNPPFLGARVMDAPQKAALTAALGKGWEGAGNLDFVAGWFKKAADMMLAAPHISSAFVATNSICQGEQVPLLWKPLLASGIKIRFAHRTFRWDSESSDKARVHCVIVGFGAGRGAATPAIYETGKEPRAAANISPYLVEGPDTVVESRRRPLCPVPEIGIGNKPIDDGNYLFTAEEMERFVKAEPASAPLFRPWYGSKEFISRTPRYCLWLGDCSPAELRAMPHALARVKAVREYRLASPSPGTRKIADTPARFHVENMPKTDFLIIPSVSSEKREYVPIGFMRKEAMASNLVLIVPDASLYHFGILTSRVHNAWMRLVGGRLEMRYRYSKDVVYNNFPWPEADGATREAIEAAARGVLDAREMWPDSSLADLYDATTMPVELRRAHKALDAIVERAYGFGRSATEGEIARELLSRYSRMAARK